MRCPSCNHDNPGDASFCEGCGAKLELICPACKASVSPGARFCKKCGTAIGPAKAAASTTVSSPKSEIIVAADGAASEAIEGERKTVTALFADIKGSMDLMEDLDPEEARAIVDPAIRLMIDAAHRYDGYVVQSTGDGIFALFGAPVAHEDHPQRALYGALRMQEEVKRYAEKLRAEKGVNLQVRVGVNTGEVVVRSITTGDGKTEYTPIGHSTSLASRLQTLANPGSVAVSEAVRKLVEGYFLLKPLGPARIKGVSEPVNVYEVTGLGPLRTRLQRAVGRGLTKFVGREREMEALKHAAERAEGGRGQIVAAMAEPGVGKSRLYFEFKATSQSGWMVLETFSVSHGKASAFLPVIDLLRNYFDISATDDERKRREKVAGRIAILDRSLEDTLPYLFSLLSIVEGDDPLAQMDGQIKKRRTLEAIKRIALRESLNQPLMVIFEDLHWIDEQTQELLNLFADSIGTAKFLLLVNYRPEYSHHWSNKTYYTQLRLDPLGKEGAEEMLSALLGTSPAPATQSPGASRERSGGDIHVAEGVRVQDELAALKRLIIERTEGNPFFVEEIVQALFEEDVLKRNGAVKLGKSMNAVKVPATVQAILASRIDRLPPDEKELLQTLAVIGQEFALSLVRRVFGGRKNDELERMLADLQMAEFIYEQPAAGEIEYIFKHALTQEVAYNSLLTSQRKSLHRQTAEAIESVHAERLEGHYGELAHHCVRGADNFKAVRYLFLAAQQELDRSAYAEAISHVTTGFELLKVLPSDSERAGMELDLTLTLAAASFTLNGPGEETASAAARACEFARQLARTRDLSEALGVLIICHLSQGNTLKAKEMAEEGITISQLLQDPVQEAFHRAYLGATLMVLGDPLGARENFEQVLANAASRPRLSSLIRRTKLNALGTLCQALWVLGFPDQALRRCREMSALEGEFSDPTLFGLGLTFAAWAAILCGEREWARDLISTLADLTGEHELSFRHVASTAFFRGWLLIAESDFEHATVLMREGIAMYEANHVHLGMSWRASILAEAYAKAGQADEALRVIDEELLEVRRFQDHMFEPELIRLRGESLLMRGGVAAQQDAESFFRQAISLANSTSAKSLELRATTSLGRLLAKQGRRDEARAMLAEIYGWFTEGFDTADLIDAKALLEELNIA